MLKLSNQQIHTNNYQGLSNREFLVGIPFKDQLPPSAQRALRLYYLKSTLKNNLKQIAIEIIDKSKIVDKIYILTGFPCHGFFETDGPIGAIILGEFLTHFNKKVIILGESDLISVLSKINKQIYPDPSLIDFVALDTIKNFNRAMLISIEYPGSNNNGFCHSMSGVHLTVNHNFEQILIRNPPYYWLALGDGGNEIGLGIFREVTNQLFFDDPNVKECGCKGGIGVISQADDVVLGITSNYASIGLIYELIANNDATLKSHWKFKWDKFRSILRLLNENGIFDGITNTRDSVDALPTKILKDLYHLLNIHYLNLNY